MTYPQNFQWFVKGTLIVKHNQNTGNGEDVHSRVDVRYVVTALNSNDAAGKAVKAVLDRLDICYWSWFSMTWDGSHNPLEVTKVNGMILESYPELTEEFDDV